MTLLLRRDSTKNEVKYLELLRVARALTVEARAIQVLGGQVRHDQGGRFPIIGSAGFDCGEGNLLQNVSKNECKDDGLILP